MPHKVTSAPASEPLTLTEAKSHLRVESGVTADDTYITGLITSVRQEVETYCNRALITQTVQEIYDTFPASSDTHLRLTLNPVQSVSSITYETASGTQTWDSANYSIDTISEPARIYPVYGQNWPTALDQPGSVKVTYVAGYGDDAADVPEVIKDAMKLILGDLYEHRENRLQSNFRTRQGPAQWYLAPYRVFRF